MENIYQQRKIHAQSDLDGARAQGRVVKELAIIALAHITGIEPAKARLLRKVA